MDLAQYFKRIGFAESFKGPDLATLKLIHKLHVMSIPFENLSIHCGEKVTMDLEDIFDKIMNRSRGGWCLENNFFFSWVLRQMGYNSTILGSRVYNNGLNDFGPLESHLINKVVIDGKAYITDVSYGVSKQIWEPLELVSGKDQIQAAGVFRLLDKGNMWVLEKSGRKPEILNPEFSNSRLVDQKRTNSIYCFTLEPRDQESFSETCISLQTDPTSLFTNKSICSMQTATGFKALIGWTLCHVTYSPEKKADFFDMRKITDEESEKVLCEEFNIRLSSKVQLLDNSPARYLM